MLSPTHPHYYSGVFSICPLYLNVLFVSLCKSKSYSVGLCLLPVLKAVTDNSIYSALLPYLLGSEERVLKSHNSENSSTIGLFDLRQLLNFVKPILLTV